ncbi:MAG: DUF5522 domain-containing protein [Bacteroidota bacterium]|jgi:hypothetical protein
MQSLIEGEDYYMSPEGRVVFTEKYHLDKGYCCGNGCRHCPYDFEGVPEPRRSELIESRNEENRSA